MFGFKGKKKTEKKGNTPKSGIEYRSVWKDLEDGSADGLLGFLGNMFGCSRVITFERTSDETYRCAGEWCAHGVNELKDTLQNMTWFEMMPWIEIHEPGNVSIIEDVESISMTNPDLYEELRRFGAKTLVTGQLAYLGEDLGFWVVINPQISDIDNTSAIFQGVFYLLGNLYHTKGTIEELEDLGFTDKLTGAANRNALTRDIDKFPVGKSLAILFADLNGMKEINDTEGHEAGDRYLINACESIRAVYPANSLYRIGGDEFLVIVSGVDEGEFLTQKEQLREEFKKREVKVAIGNVFAENYEGNFEELRQVADDMMYKDKKSSYKTFEAEEGEPTSSRPDEVMEVYPQEDGYRIIYCVPHKYDGRGGRAKTGIFSKKLHEIADEHVHPSDKIKYLNFWTVSSLITSLEKNDHDAAIMKYRARTVDGFWCWVEEQITMLRRDNNRLVLIASIRDISDQRPREEIMHNKSSSSEDFVAQRQLYLNRKFNEQAEEWLSKRVVGDEIIVIAVNLGHLRLYNDTFGREAGDKVIQTATGVLAQGAYMFRGISAYLGGDNFCLVGLLGNFADTNELAEYLEKNLRQYSVAGGFAPSIGIYSTKNITESFAAMHDRALIALSSVKGDYKNHIHIYASEDFKTEKEVKTVQVQEIQLALAQNEFVCYFQPVVDASDASIVSVEALMRWQHGVNLVKAEKFMDVLDDSGYILALDVASWRNVCAWIKSFLDKGVRPLPVSMNISYMDFHYVNVAEMLIRLTGEYGIDTSLLIVELSEKVYVDNPQNTTMQINRLREAGFKVYMDNVTGGFDSFSMLYGTTVDGIKLDRSYLDMLSVPARKFNPIRTFMNLGTETDMIVISEGAETRSQVEMLYGLGCRYIQGNCYYRPMTIADYEKILLTQMEKKGERNG